MHLHVGAFERDNVQFCRLRGQAVLLYLPVQMGIRSPKRRVVAEEFRANWFRYYPGFSVGFVEDILAQLALPIGSTILDPWLGAGTTSEVATAKKYRIRGFDLNPAMLIVAKARTLATSDTHQIPSLAEAISRSYQRRRARCAKKSARPMTEQLEQWLQPAAARAFRVLERCVAEAVQEEKPSTSSPIWARPNDAPAILAFFYVALFRSLRHFITEFQSSNPTWVKVSGGGERVQLSPDRILNRFCTEIETLLTALASEKRVMPSVGSRTCIINVASSMQLPLSTASVDAVVSSPPYCTRIDYVRATLPELAVIGYPNGDFTRRLRDDMIGTPTMSRAQHYDGTMWSRTCSDFLSTVQQHSSKASSTYYLKYYRQYFASAFASMSEIDRVLKRCGQCVLVVQDSFYKDVPNDVPRIFVEMAKHLGWHLNERIDFPVKQTFAGVNPQVKKYRNKFDATEWVLIFSK